MKEIDLYTINVDEMKSGSYPPEKVWSTLIKENPSLKQANGAKLKGYLKNPTASNLKKFVTTALNAGVYVNVINAPDDTAIYINVYGPNVCVSSMNEYNEAIKSIEVITEENEMSNNIKSNAARLADVYKTLGSEFAPDKNKKDFEEIFDKIATQFGVESETAKIFADKVESIDGFGFDAALWLLENGSHIDDYYAERIIFLSNEASQGDHESDTRLAKILEAFKLDYTEFWDVSQNCGYDKESLKAIISSGEIEETIKLIKEKEQKEMKEKNKAEYKAAKKADKAAKKAVRQESKQINKDLAKERKALEKKIKEDRKAELKELPKKDRKNKKAEFKAEDKAGKERARSMRAADKKQAAINKIEDKAKRKIAKTAARATKREERRTARREAVKSFGMGIIRFFNGIYQNTIGKLFFLVKEWEEPEAAAANC